VSPRRTVLAVAGLGVTAVLASSLIQEHPAFVWNATASAPIGLYAVLPTSAPRVGDWVLLRLDPDTAAAFATRGYLPAGVPLLKRVRAVAGTAVCARDGALFIAGAHIVDTLPVDAVGRPLAAWRGCRTLATGEILVLNADVPTSLDGRYLGPSPVSAVVGRAVPLWTWRR
jgi:conjugative transfer signal peptidase TraF